MTICWTSSSLMELENILCLGAGNMEKEFILCSLLEKGTWLLFAWGTTMQMRLSKFASRGITSGKQSLAFSWHPKVGEAEKWLAGSLPSLSRLSTEQKAQGFCAVFLETGFEPVNQCSVEGFLHKLVSLSTLQLLGPGSDLRNDCI